ncbi:hypothetical protein CLV47_104119 [Antricoccus suffuscus]|uniref:Uncharacterized protein n=1 Tax=Antricoccus suffuscus TaxID=1629062 RepID=A0A2T1A2G0_9ACTN|nr:hypothetical protein [Antricoccus suffuscus]PRZ42773.1 hypothetical protein CLV47_104119 [Antricoccus suffuscus]
MRRTTAHRRPGWLVVLRAFLATYVVLALVGGILTIAATASPSFNSNTDGANAISNDVADSISRFNQDSDSEEPSWTGDDFLAAVAGHESGGQIVRMPGADTYLDDATIIAATAGTKVLVVVTPPTPLGAVEKTRVRDNTVQKYWAQKRGLSVVMVHGQEVYLPGPDLYVISTPSTGVPMREAMRTGDATSTVVYVAKTAAAYVPGTSDYQDITHAGSDATTAKTLALTDTRPPTEAELAPITAALDAGDLFVDPSISPRPEYKKAWGAVAPGKTLKVAILPYAAPGTAVDYAGALAQRYPDDAVLVMTGKWIESAGVDRQIMVDAYMQVYGLGGFSFAASAPQYGAVLDWVTNVAGSAIKSHAFDRPLPSLPETSFPRWVSYLLLATSLLIAVGFGLEYLIERRRPVSSQSRQQWRDHVSSALAASYLGLSTAPYLGKDGGLTKPPEIQALLDGAYADLLTLHGIDVDHEPAHAGQIALAAWDALDHAARDLDRPGSGPTQSLPAAMRVVPEPARPAKPSLFARIKAKLTKRVRRADKPALVGRVVIVVVIIGFAGFFVKSLTSPADFSTQTTADISALSTSNVLSLGDLPRKEIAAISQDIGNRAMLVAVADSSQTTNPYNLANAMAAEYPDAVVFVVQDGDVKAAQIGSDARIGKYNKYSLIDDYSGLENPSGGNEPLVRQLALLYDQLAAEHSIAQVNRNSYDPPTPPWGWIAAGLVIALAATAFLVSAATRRTSLRERERDEERATREALSLRLGAVAPVLLDAGPAVDQALLARLGAEHSALMDRVAAGDPTQLDDLRTEIDAYVQKVRSSVPAVRP